MRFRRNACVVLLMLGQSACGSAPSAPRSAPPARVVSTAVPTAPAATATPAARVALPVIEGDPTPGEAGALEDRTLVEFSFETTARAVAPSNTFWLAAHFKLSPGYRIFWINPGNSGRATRVEFAVPQGFELSEVRFPPPTKFELPDGGVSYGYEEETAVFAEVRAMPDLERDRDYRFEVEASWLACAERCFPEGTSAFLEIGVGEGSEIAPFTGSMGRLLASLPRPLGELAGVSYQWRRGGRLHVSAAGTQWLEFIPARTDDPKLVEVGMNAKRTELKLRFEDGSPGSRVKGLAVTNARGGRDYVSIDIPWPERASK